MRFRRARWLILLIAVVALAIGGATLALPAPPYQGHVVYLRLGLAPGPSSPSWESQYWIDPARGRLVYAEAVSGTQGDPPLTYDDHPGSRPSGAWTVITLARRPDGKCSVVYTTLLSNDERGDAFDCAGLLAFTNADALKAHMLALMKRYGVAARLGSETVRVPLPAGADPIPLVMDHVNMHYGYEHLQAGTLTLDERSGLPLTTTVYWREGRTLTEYVRRVEDLPPGSLPGDFFDAPRLSLPDRAPNIYRWLHETLPWHP